VLASREATHVQLTDFMMTMEGIVGLPSAAQADAKVLHPKRVAEGGGAERAAT